MDLITFQGSLSSDRPQDDLPPAAEALWWDAKGDWERAHACVQDETNPEAAWVHAYLHRKEGDLSNAAYWYRRAGRPATSASLSDEWTTIAAALLPSG